MLSNLISLPFLKAEPYTLMGIILIISLILVVLDTDEIRVHGIWIEGESDESIDCSGLRDNLECP